MTSLLTTETLAIATHGYISASRAPETKRAYRRQWAAFVAWGGALPAAPESVASYAAHLAGRGIKVSGIEQAMAAITAAHRAADLPNPRDSAVVSATLAGIRRELRVAPVQKAPLTVVEVTRLANFADGPDAIRDRALVLLGFAGGFRRSELVALDAEDMSWSHEGVVVTIRRSKTDQEGAGAQIAIPSGLTTEALRAVMPESGPIFTGVDGRLKPASVARIVKRLAKKAGLDPSRLAGHSLRSGMATAAAKNGASERAIMAHGRWASVTMARRYIRSAEIFNECAVKGLGL
jgi:integrase